MVFWIQPIASRATNYPSQDANDWVKQKLEALSKEGMGSVIHR